MRAVIRSSALLVVASIAFSSTAEAQRVTDSRLAVAAPTSSGFEAQQAQEIKSPAVAGVLSWIIPGVGSYYAGHNGHGTRHLAIHVGAIVGLVVGAAQAVDDCTFDSNFEYNCSEGSFALYGVSLLVYFANDIWSIFTAVGDARNFNKNANPGARPGRVVGEFVAPAIINLRDVKGTDGSVEQRTGLRVLKFSY